MSFYLRSTQLFNSAIIFTLFTISMHLTTSVSYALIPGSPEVSSPEDNLTPSPTPLPTVSPSPVPTAYPQCPRNQCMKFDAATNTCLDCCSSNYIVRGIEPNKDCGCRAGTKDIGVGCQIICPQGSVAVLNNGELPGICKSECDLVDDSYYTLKVIWAGESDQYNSIYQVPPEKNKVSNQVYSWFKSVYTRCLSINKSINTAQSKNFKNPKSYKPAWFVDDCVAAYFTSSEPGGGKLFPHSGMPLAARVYGYDSVGAKVLKRGTLVFNSRFEPVTSIPEGAKVCSAGQIQWRESKFTIPLGNLSPISLLWQEDVDIDQDIRLVTFPINPSMKNQWYLWKASEKAPLLIYDPEHRGTVESGVQLFGNWTFGGKHLASLVNPESLGRQTAEWRDGFEALGSLDRNADGKISDEELEPLALWFDADRDGVTQEGEVKKLSDVGVVALYYKADRKEAATGSIVATLGYERIVNGKVVRGTSVDWFTDHASTKEELITKHLARGTLSRSRANTANQASELTVSDGNKSPNFSPESTEQDKNEQQAAKPLRIGSHNNISGLWTWKADDIGPHRGEYAPQGLLGFSDNDSGSIRGHSYSEMQFRPNSEDIQNLLSIHFFQGTKKVEQGRLIYEFQVNTEEGTVIDNEAELLDNGTRLKGKSTAKVQYDEKDVSITYTWNAERFDPEPEQNNDPM